MPLRDRVEAYANRLSKDLDRNLRMANKPKAFGDNEIGMRLAALRNTEMYLIRYEIFRDVVIDLEDIISRSE